MMAQNLTLEQLRAGDTPQLPTRLPKNEIQWWQVNTIQATKIYYGDFAINKGEMSIGFGNAVFRADSNGIYLGDRVYGDAPFRVDMSGNLYAENVNLTGEVNATSGTIGGFTITPTEMYGGIIKTGQAVGAGESGVVMDTDGLRGYSNVLGEVFNLPTDGSAPTFSSGVIENTVFEINTNAVMRTSDNVGTPTGITELERDDFDDNSFDTSSWSRTNSTNIVETNGELQLTTNLGIGYFNATRIDTVDLTNKIVSIKLVSTTSLSKDYYESYPLELTLDSDNKLLILLGYSALICIKREGGNNTEVFNGTYNSTNHKYLRIREGGGTIYFDYSADGDNWSSFGNTTVGYNINNLVVSITVGHWDTETEVSKMVIDDFTISESASAGGAGVLINNTGLYACEEGQTLDNANVKILATGEAVFSGRVRGGMTDFMEGEGYFMGESGGEYKLAVGNPDGNFMSWDSEQLRIRGIIELDGPLNLEGYATVDLPVPPSNPGLSLATSWV